MNVNRYLKVRRFLEKRQKRIWNTRISYAVRKEVACKRPRVAGKFIKKQSQGINEPEEREILNLVTIQPLKIVKKPQPPKNRTPTKQAQPRKAAKEKLLKEESAQAPPKGPKEKRQAKKKAKDPKPVGSIATKAAKKKGNKKNEKTDEQP